MKKLIQLQITFSLVYFYQPCSNKFNADQLGNSKLVNTADPVCDILISYSHAINCSLHINIEAKMYKLYTQHNN